MADSRMRTLGDQIYTSDPGCVVFHPSTSALTPPIPDPNLTAILRLYLERYDILDEEDRRLYRQTIRMINSPLSSMEKEPIR